MSEDTTRVLADFSKHIAPLNSVAVMPDGNKLSREEVLKKLNLDPNIAPDAWLAIIGCGSNASALRLDDAKALVERGVLDESALDPMKEITMSKDTTRVLADFSKYIAPLNSVAVVPDGNKLPREEVLKKLNLDPNIAPDAWLAIIGCGSNAAALRLDDAKALIERGVLDESALETIRARYG